MLSFIRKSRLNCVGHVSRMDNNRRVSQVFNNNLQGSRLTGRPKTDVGTWYKEISINVILHIGKGGQKAELTGRISLRR
jgi:hypothetical protein